MSSLETVTVRSIAVYQPVKSAKRQCRFHANRTTCNLTQSKVHTDRTAFVHYTTIDSRFCSTNGDPYYEWLLTNNAGRRLHRFNNAYKTICGVEFELDQGEVMRELDEAGEVSVDVIRMVMRRLYAFLENDRGAMNGHADDTVAAEAKVYVLFNEMYIDCMYSFRQCIVMPQEMYCLYRDGEEPIINSHFHYNTVPEYEDAILSQHIYKAFIMYNTVLTMMLRQRNPFNDSTRVISKIVESVGTCNGGEEGSKRTRIKVCDLKFGGEVPGHVMCPPREMVKSIYKYSKWRLNPKNYSRYYGLLVDDSIRGREKLREWAIFIANFKTYFFPSV
ncbi:vp1054 [Clostera anastomosis granulovirus A]|uniref:Vp1054 n=1 Tax=Clostera anastomosis granulovirus A TaxID=1986289 RepID=U5KAX7_9BBAC|nr:vp1054 [Clostera anastomosis granulovirus Henan]AGQ20377.1 vp1054 [Clostera anastomosis granulovirus Henan]